MRIIVLGLRGFPNVQGGIEKHAESLYPLLVQYGYQIDVIVRSPYVPRSQRTWKGITFHRLWAPRLRGIEALLHSIFGVFYAAFIRPDILHIHAIGPAIVTPLARVLNLRVVVTHHGPDYDREKWGIIARWLLRLGEKYGMRYANGRIVISDVIHNSIKDKYYIDSDIIPNGVSLPEIPNTSYALQTYRLTKKHYILLVSRFVPEKRHLDLIYAFNEARLKGWKLVLVGSADHPDDYSKNIELVAKKYPDIVITGLQSGIKLAELYANAGIFVLPSSHEGHPIVILEALSYGLIVIASNIPANLEIGLSQDQYYPLGDINLLTNKIKQYSEKSNNIGDRDSIRKWISSKYDWKEIAKKTKNVYESIY